MKLDLINNRFPVNLGPRIYDSIEGEHIQHPPAAPKVVSKASFLSKQKRIDYSPKTEKIPDRFNLSVVDSHGNFMPMDKTKRFRPKQSLSLKPQLTFQDSQKELKETQSDFLGLERFPSKLVDYKKDHIYPVKEDTVERRLESGLLPGAVWPLVGRKATPPKYKVGPGDYEVYDTNLTNRGWQVQRGGQFNNQPSGREHEEIIDPGFLPLKERQRYQRRKAAENERLATILRPTSASKTAVHVSSAASIHSVGTESQRKASPAKHGTLGGGGTKSRFDDKIYKQEFFVKTSGMRLSQDWDKPLNKKIPFSFQAPSHNPPKSPPKSEGADVDVDVGHMFSIVRTAELSPIKFSAAFRSTAPVGMDIPVPTSGTEIGPGSFPGAYAESIEIKLPDRPSHFILRGRPDNTRMPLPELTEPILTFAERHRAGPIFEKQKIDGGNLVLQELVKTRMKKIYPKLAKVKFPPPPPSRVGSPWKKSKRK